MDASVLLPVAVVVLTVGLFFFGLGVEALRHYSGSRLRHLLRHRPTVAKRMEELLHRGDELLSAALVWLTLVEVALVAVIAGLLGARTDWPAEVRLAGAVVLTAAAVVVLRRSIATALAERRAEEILLTTLPALAALTALTKPLAAVERFIAKIVFRLLGESETRPPHEAIPEEILSAVDEGEREGVFAGEEADMIESIISLRDLDVHEVMTPRTDLVWLPAEASLQEAVRVIQQSGHSRIPVFGESHDDVVGILYAKDLLAPLSCPTEATNCKVEQLVRKPLFVPETKPVWQLLQEFRRERLHVAIVVDEYGGTAGLVTVEDILEEVVGEISDEYDRGQPPSLRRLTPTTAEVDARLRVDELNNQLGTHIPEREEYDTVGGLAFYTLGRVPGVGERFRVANVDFTITEANSHRVRRLKVEVLPEEPGD